MGDSSAEILSTRPALDKLLQPKLRSAQTQEGPQRKNSPVQLEKLHLFLHTELCSPQYELNSFKGALTGCGLAQALLYLRAQSLDTS